MKKKYQKPSIIEHNLHEVDPEYWDRLMGQIKNAPIVDEDNDLPELPSFV